ncbi:MAG: helix-turn-helix transcriptional regulator [Bacteroidota bacterium]
MKNDIPLYAIEHLKLYKNEGVLVSRFGYYANLHQHLYTAHRHSFFHLVFFTAGSGTQQIDFKKFAVKPGLIYFMIPGQVHRWDFETEPDGYIINFDKTYLSTFLTDPNYLENFSFFSGQTDLQVLELDEATQNLIIPIFEEILAEGTDRLKIGDDLVKVLILKLFIEVSRFSKQQKNSNINLYSYTLLKNFQDLIAQNYAQIRLPKQYAVLLYITPNHLNALCKDLLGIPAGAVIRERVVLEAKRLLINVDLTIAQIAEKLNFKDHSYFIKFFKKYEAITPEKFRKNNT